MARIEIDMVEFIGNHGGARFISCEIDRVELFIGESLPMLLSTLVTGIDFILHSC